VYTVDVDSPDDEALTPEQRAAIREAIGGMGLTDYLRKMCSMEVSPADEAMIASWWCVQIQNVELNIEVAFANGYIQGKKTGRRCPITLT